MSLVAFSSVKGGVGVTASAANIAASLSKQGVTTALADLSGVDEAKTLFGVHLDTPVFGSTRPDADGSLHHGVRLASWPRNQTSGASVLDFLTSAALGSEVTIIDLSGADAGVQQEVRPRSTLNILVLSADAASILAAPRALEHHLASENGWVMVNRVDARNEISREAVALFEATFREKIIGSVRRDESVNEAAACLTPVPIFSPTSASGRDYAKVAAKINQLLPALLMHFSKVES